jgi:hypothetical protein
MCDGQRGCPTWEGDSGANACVVLEPEELTDSLSTPPRSRPSIEIQREARIVRWLKNDDGITASQAADFFNKSDLLKLPKRVVHRALPVTRLGSVPSWCHAAVDEAPQGDWRFAGQLASFYSFLTPPETDEEDIQPDPWHLAGCSHVACGLSSFGFDGIAYVFLREAETRPEGWLLWQLD